jgi:hypothetical protein
MSYAPRSRSSLSRPEDHRAPDVRETKTELRLRSEAESGAHPKSRACRCSIGSPVARPNATIGTDWRKGTTCSGPSAGSGVSQRGASPARRAQQGPGLDRQGFSSRHFFAQACTSYRLHIRPRASSPSGLGKPFSSAIWWARCLVTPRSSTISTRQTVRAMLVSSFLAPGHKPQVSGLLGSGCACELVLSGCPSKASQAFWGVRTKPSAVTSGSRRRVPCCSAARPQSSAWPVQHDRG